MTAPPARTIRPSTTLGDLVNRHPHLVPALDHMQLDYCCGGHRSLAEACAEAGIDVDGAIDRLTSEAGVSRGGASELSELARSTPSALADHIELTHHAFLRDELPRLGELADRVVSVHGDRHPELADVRDTLDALRLDLEPHLDREEQILFPLVREIDAALLSGHSANGELKNPVSVLHDDHEQIGGLLAQLRELTNSFTTPDDGCASYRMFYEGLRGLTDDTHLHVHKENNILFPAAIERERQLREHTGS